MRSIAGGGAHADEDDDELEEDEDGHDDAEDAADGGDERHWDANADEPPRALLAALRHGDLVHNLGSYSACGTWVVVETAAGGVKSAVHAAGDTHGWIGLAVTAATADPVGFFSDLKDEDVLEYSTLFLSGRAHQQALRLVSGGRVVPEVAFVVR